jgi:hypothetical protein
VLAVTYAPFTSSKQHAHYALDAATLLSIEKLHQTILPAPGPRIPTITR